MVLGKFAIYQSQPKILSDAQNRGKTRKQHMRRNLLMKAAYGEGILEGPPFLTTNEKYALLVAEWNVDEESMAGSHSNP